MRRRKFLKVALAAGLPFGFAMGLVCLILSTLVAELTGRITPFWVVVGSPLVGVGAGIAFGMLIAFGMSLVESEQPAWHTGASPVCEHHYRHGITVRGRMFCGTLFVHAIIIRREDGIAPDIPVQLCTGEGRFSVSGAGRINVAELTPELLSTLVRDGCELATNEILGVTCMSIDCPGDGKGDYRCRLEADFRDGKPVRFSLESTYGEPSEHPPFRVSIADEFAWSLPVAASIVRAQLGEPERVEQIRSSP